MNSEEQRKKLAEVFQTGRRVRYSIVDTADKLTPHMENAIDPRVSNELPQPGAIELVRDNKELQARQLCFVPVRLLLRIAYAVVAHSPLR